MVTSPGFGRVSPGRIAGLLYLAVVIGSVFSLFYVPGQLQLTAVDPLIVQRIVNRPELFRAGLASWVATQIAFMLLPIALYRVLGNANPTAGVLMVVFALISVPFSLVAVAYRADALMMATASQGVVIGTPELRAALVVAAIESAKNAQSIATLFWGLWLAPLGYLIIKSKALPRALGIFLILGCVGYAVNFFGALLVAGYRELGIQGYVAVPASIGELGTCLWLLIKGAAPLANGETKSNFSSNV